ncbi:MAG: FimB/Mfa2 family fimbrial subunit [Alistipes sp.]|nr:FimB/Mfa2 family fimbrial subunit [Alistipes sp.]
MTGKRMIIYRSIFTVLAAALLLCSCMKEKAEADQPGGGPTLLTFTLKVPGGTRALDPASHEVEVGDITVLLCDPLGGGFIAAYPGQNIAADFSSFQVVLPDGTYDMVLLANCKRYIENLYPAGIPAGTSRQDLVSSLTVDLPGKWVADASSAAYRPIPMFAEKANITIADQNSLADEVFQLTRMLAKINLTLSAEAAANFQLEAIHVYHRNTKGQIIPSPANLGTATDLQGETYPLVTAPSIPVGTGVDQKSGLVYKRSDGEIDAGGKCEEEIYIFEALKGVPGNHPQYFCLILEGKYLPTGTTGFYRLDFIESGTGQYLDILRNHRYDVVIEHVLSSGQIDEEDAYHSVTADLAASVTPWDLYSYDIFLGDITLNVSQTEVDVNEYTMARVWFTSNYPNVRIEQFAADGSTDLEKIFPGVTEAASLKYNFDYTYDEANRRGSGYFDLSTDRFSPAGLSAGTYRYELLLNAGGVKRVVTVNVTISPDELPDRKYIGAFWRNDQTGERLISMPGYSNWSAQVTEGADWIRLQKGKSIDPAVWSDGIPSDAENYQLTNGTTFIEGDFENDNTTAACFRIGLTGTHSGAPRYGKVTFTDKTTGTSHIIFIRQGEEADYILRAEDRVGWMTARNNVRRFPPYNITSREWKAGWKSGGNSLSDHSLVRTYGGVFTDYPTQAGSYFQFSGSADGDVWGYHPANPAAGNNITGFISTYPSTASFWTQIRSVHEVCPLGYRRPNAGVTSGYSPVSQFLTAELGQSFFHDHLSNVDQFEDDYCTWGFYADGFFDRRRLVDVGDGTDPFYGVYDTGAEYNIAYEGMLLWSPFTGASLFFPAGGYRSDTGALLSAGSEVTYWSNTINTGIYPYFFYGVPSKGIAINIATPLMSRLYATPIRCIAEP